jgi:hypothetical protein
MAQPEKRENSVLFSLRELRQIEESRVSEEENAVRNAEAAKLRNPKPALSLMNSAGSKNSN